MKVEVQFLADVPEVIPAIACLHQLEMRLGERSNYWRTQSRFQQRLQRDQLPLSLVAFVDTLPIGSISLVHDDDLESHAHLAPWIASLFVATPYQKQGIGQRLVREVEAIARQQQFSHLYLWTWSATSYYDKLGWSIIDSVHPEEFPQSVVMQKPLLNPHIH